MKKPTHIGIYIEVDFNRVDESRITNENPGIKRITSPATRGDATLDLVLTNFGNLITDTKVYPPLETETGICSDHSIVTNELEIPSSHTFEWIIYKTRVITDKGKERFGKLE